MSNSYLNIANELKKSQTFGSLFSDYLSETNPTLTSLFIKDIQDLYNPIILSCELTDFQQKMLVCLFEEFSRIRTEIDPNKIKPFKFSYNNDNELLLYRITNTGLVNLTINPEDCISFAYIPKNKNDEKLFFFIEKNGDFEKLALHFLR